MRKLLTRATSSVLSSFSGLRKSDRPKRSPVKEDGDPQNITAKKEKLNGLRVKELKSTCDDAGVSVVGLFEKSEIVAPLVKSVMKKETGKAKEQAQECDPTYKDAVAMVDREKQEEILVVAEESLSSMVEENRQDELIIEEKKQQESSANEALMVDGEKQKEIPVVAEVSPMEENRQDELPPVEKSNKDDAEKNILFQLIYSLRIYFDHTELDEVIKRLSSCGTPHSESKKLVSRNISVTGDTSGSDAAPTSDSDDAAVVLEDLNRSPRVLVYEENRISFIDECFDTLDGVEYCSAVVNAACNPCTSLLHVQDRMENEMKEREHTVVNVSTTTEGLAEE